MAEDSKIIDPNTVYISFTGADKETVESFVGMLKANNIPYRVSIEEDIDSISEFEKEIGKGMIVVIFYSPDYFKSYHCMNEYALIRENEQDKDIFTFKYTDFKFDEIEDDLDDYWGREQRKVSKKKRKEGFDNLTEVQKAAYHNEFYIEEDEYKDKREISIYRLENFFRDKQYKKDLTTLLECVQNAYRGRTPQQVSCAIPAASAPSLPKMTIREGIVPREKEVKDLKKLLDENRLVNMIGLGGCGKSTISECFCNKYNQAYHIVTSVVVSIDYYKDFVERFREVVGVPYKFDDDFKNEAAKTPSYKKTYDAIIEQLESYQYKGRDGKQNLIVIDINETADYEPVRKELTKFRNRLSLWKILVVSRVKMCSGIKLYEPLNVTEVGDKVLEKIFYRYLDNEKRAHYKKELKEHLSQLFKFLFHLPLLIEQLAYFLNNDIFDKTYQEILSDLKINVDLFNERFAGRNVPDKEKYEKIEDYLGSLIIFSKLDDLTQTGALLRYIARHFAILPTGFYGLDFIKRFVCVSDRSYTIGEGLRFLVDKCILTAKEDKKSLQMHGLVAETCRRQIYTLDKNKAFRNFDGFKQRVDDFDKTYDHKKQQDKDYRAAIADSFTNIIPNTIEEDNYVLRKAHQYENKDIYEHILKVKLLRLQNLDGSLFVHLNTEDFVKKSVDQLYYSWLQKQPDKVLVPKHTDRDGNVFLSIEGVEIKMIKVDGGTFKMGMQYKKVHIAYDEDEDGNESPVHNVTLSDFYIGETQVTQGLWKIVMGKDNNPSCFKKGDDYPVERVSWYDCLNFIIELNKKTGLKFRFPTEAQWEFAARGGTKKTRDYEYSGSDKLSEVAWYGYGWPYDDKNRTIHTETTMPVRQLKANALGLYDMSGNVREWCQDWYDFYSSGNVENPLGPSSGSSRVLRGGSWDTEYRTCRVSNRFYVNPDGWDRGFGLRLALLPHS